MTVEQANGLIDLCEPVTIKKGDVLFYKVDPSDSMYILTLGKLAAVLDTKGQEKFIGAINVGETVGELGGLSNRPRALTVKATQNSELLKLSNKNIVKFWNPFHPLHFT